LAVDPVAFRIFNMEIRWYGILIAMSLVIGILIAYFIAKYRNQREEEVINFAPFAVVFAIIGSRILHVIVNWSYYSNNLSYIYAFRRGGLAIQGVMLGGILALLVFCKIRKLNFWMWADIVAPALVMGQAIGRWGNFFNQEAYGKPTDLPWGIFIDLANRVKDYERYDYFHPTFLYESIANLILFLLLLLLHRIYKKNPDKFPCGLIFAVYLGIYSIYRTFIEYYRIDSSYIGGIKVVYILNVITIIAAIIIAYILISKFREKKRLKEIQKIEE